MNFKRRLGIETFPMEEKEVNQKWCDAHNKGDSELVLSLGNCIIKIGMDRITEENMNLDNEY